MSALTPIVLKCGAQVSRAAALSVHYNIKILRQKNPYALYNLYHKCVNPKYELLKNPLEDSQQILKKRRLLQDDGSAHEEVQKIIKNAMEVNSKGEVNVTPLPFKQITFNPTRL